jgi:hypothetical protein
MFFIVFFLFFSSTKSENRKAEQVLPRGVGWHQCEGEGIGEKDRRINTLEKKLYTCNLM